MEQIGLIFDLVGTPTSSSWSPMELGAIDLGENENGFHEFQTKKRRKEAKILADKVMKKGKSKGLSQKEIEEESNAVYNTHPVDTDTSE